MTLQDQLDEITRNTRLLVQPERLEISERAIEDLFQSGAEQRILQPGQMAPEFELTDSTGPRVRSADLLALGPLIVNFFRGRWCPYCVTELEAWREAYPAVRERGAMMVAISPQTVRHNDFTAMQHSIPFPLLSDPGCKVAECFGLAYELPDYQRSYYRSIMVNIPFVNGDDTWSLPLPATYVIARDGTILYADAHADFRVRPEPAEVMAALK
jgi:peroxiredoxin